MVRTNRPQCAPLLCRSGASSGTVTGVARIAAMVVADIGGVEADAGAEAFGLYAAAAANW